MEELLLRSFSTSQTFNEKSKTAVEALEATVRNHVGVHRCAHVLAGCVCVSPPCRDCVSASSLRPSLNKLEPSQQWFKCDGCGLETQPVAPTAAAAAAAALNPSSFARTPAGDPNDDAHVAKASMFALHFDIGQHQNDLKVCLACHVRGAPPPDSDARPWPQAKEALEIALRHPHVTLGAHLVEVSHHHAQAHREVAARLEGDGSLAEWSVCPTDYPCAADALLAMMRQFRSTRPEIQGAVQQRMQLVAGACGFEGKLNFCKATVEDMEALDAAIESTLVSDAFLVQVDCILQSSGSATEQRRALEIAIADHECRVMVEHGLTPSHSSFQVLLHRNRCALSAFGVRG